MALMIRLPAEVEARLTALAARTGRTKTFYAREALLTHLEDLEDRYLGERALDAFRAAQEPALPLAEMFDDDANDPAG